MKFYIAIFSCMLLATNVAAQPTVAQMRSGKKVMTPEAYYRWKNIDHPVLSNDGKWAVYTLISPSGDCELVVRSTQSDTEWRFPRGRSHERPVFTGWWGEIDGAQITADSKFVLFSISNFKSNSGAASPSSLGIMSLSNGQVTTVPQVASYKLPEISGHYVAYLVSADVEAQNTNNSSRSVMGKELVLRNLQQGNEVRIKDVASYLFDSKGQSLAYTISGVDENNNGVSVRRLVDGQTVSLVSGKGGYNNLTFDDAGRQLAFLSDRNDQEAAKPRLGVYYAPSLLGPAEEVVSPKAPGDANYIVPGSGLKFTGAGNALVFRVGPVPVDPLPKGVQAENPVFDLWHWKDYQPQNRQSDQPPSYLSVYHLGARHWVQLANDTVPDAILTADAKYAVGVNQRPYVVERMTLQAKADLYLINTQSGKSTLFRRGVILDMAQIVSTTIMVDGLWGYLSPIQLSPNGKYLLTLENSRWYSYDFSRGVTVDLTGRLLPRNRFNDNQSWSSKGVAGWTKEDQKVLLFSIEDIWEIDPTGKGEPINLTGGIAGTAKYQYRLKVDRDSSSFGRVKKDLDPESQLVASVFDPETMATGFCHIRLGRRQQKSPVMFDKKTTFLAEAKNGGQYLATQETFREFPDLWTGQQLDRLKKISDANPQQSEYLWGSVELVESPSPTNKPLKGLLYKPEGFDPAKRYPMIVSVYQENLSGALHDYQMPQPMMDADLQHYGVNELLSRGYLVFEPDIESFPESSAGMITETVVRAVKRMIERGSVDPTRIGLMGASYGGYEVASIIGRTDMFRAAVMGCTWVNLVSYYSDFNRNGPGGPGWTESGQARMGGSIWDKPLAYVDASAIFRADRVRTPLLIMQNDADPGVPLQQGVDFYMALRRNDKEVYLFNYNGEGHGIFRHANRLHWTRTFHEFFDFFLKDESKPDWMEHGIPHWEKGRNLGHGLNPIQPTAKPAPTKP